MQNNTPKPPQGGNNNLFTNGMRAWTLVLVAFFIIFGFGLLVYQLYVLQLRDRADYSAQAADQQLSDEIIPAARGSIYSATGKILARSNVVWTITADPQACDEAYIVEASEKISELLGGSVSAETILQRLSDRESRYKVIARNVDMPTATAILEYTNTRRTKVEGDNPAKVLYFYREQSSTREYPYGTLMASVLGFCNNDGEGVYGLENSYQDLLSGTPGRVISSENAWGYELANEDADTHDAIDGYNLNLTIDENIQAIVEEYLLKAIEDYNVQNRASAIVMNVNTGAVLAMASVEQFDPNNPYTIYDETMADILEGGTLTAEGIAILQSRIGKKEVADIVADGMIGDDEYTSLQGMMREAQWKNKNITELYYPGSVFKLVTAASALDSDLMDTNQSFYCSGEMKVFEGTEWETSYHCAEGTAHGWLDLTGALNHSCNLYFIQAAQTMSAQTFSDYFQAFGFTEATGIDLPYETRWMQYYTAAQMEQVTTNLYSSSFGQAQKITPLQMATAIAAIVNGGYLVTPYVVDSITDNTGNVIRQTETTIKRQVVSEEVSAQIRSMMANIVGTNSDAEYHSGANAYVAGYQIGGKSGTAEELDLDVRDYDGDYRKAISFSAVMPIDDPEIQIFVMMDDPRWTFDYASQIVAPVVGNIISEVAPYLGIARDPAYNAAGSTLVPNCVNTSWTSAQIALNVQGLGHKIMGSTGDIVYQYPYAGTYVPAGSTIYLYTTTDQDATTIVPDVLGKTGSFAAQMLKAAGLNVQIEGDEGQRVVSQDMAVDSSLPMGSVVTIQTGSTEPQPQEQPQE